MYDFWDVNTLTLTELDEIIELTKIHGSETKALRVFNRKYPGKIKHCGEINSTGDFIHDEITIDGVKETKGFEAIQKIIGDRL